MWSMKFVVGNGVVVINNKVVIQPWNPTGRNTEEPHGAANLLQREIAANEFVEFLGVFFRTGLLQAVVDLLFVSDDLLPDGILVHALRPERANRAVLPH